MAWFSDNFDRADSSDLGALWDAGYPSIEACQIVGQRVRATNLAATAMESYNGITLGNDKWAQVTLATFTGSIVLNAGVLVNGSAPGSESGYMFLVLRNDGSRTSTIVRLDEGIGTILTDENATTWAATDVLRGERRGNGLYLYRNGSLLLSTTDTTYTSGRIGVRVLVGASGSLANNELDNFAGGDTFDLGVVLGDPMVGGRIF